MTYFAQQDSTSYRFHHRKQTALPTGDYVIRHMNLQEALLIHDHQNMQDGWGSLNVIDLHNIIGSDTTRRCGFVRVARSLLEEACHCGGFEVSYVQDIIQYLQIDFLLPSRCSTLSSSTISAYVIPQSLQ